MAYIKVDSRGCGAGKTHTTIIPQIKNNMKMGVKTLLVVPSKDLQHEYAKNFHPTHCQVINRDTHEQTVSQQYAYANKLLVIMTHEGWLRTTHRTKQNVMLIIDEVFDPFGKVDLETANQNGKVVLDLSELVNWTHHEYVPLTRPTNQSQPFYELDFDKSRGPSSVNKETWQQLTNPNVKLFATWNTHANLKSKSAEVSTLYTEFDAHNLFQGWSSVWIAAAKFEDTLMGLWLEQSGLDFDVVHKFKLHTTSVKFHIPPAEFSWTKTFRMGEQGLSLQHKFIEYVEATRCGPLYYNANNNSNVAIPGAHQISHNAHGLNGYSTFTEYAFISSIKPAGNYRNFLVDRLEITHNAGEEPGARLEFAFTAYTAYQLLMRSALRNPNHTTVVNAYFLDTRQARLIMDLFTNADVALMESLGEEISIRNQKVLDDKAQRQMNKKPPLTQAQKQKAYRLRQKAIRSLKDSK